MTDLTREDMALINGRPFRVPVVKQLRETHHRVARLIAAGVRHAEIVELTGYSSMTISNLRASPAFKDLIAHYTPIVDAQFERAVDEYYTDATRNMKLAEKLISERLETASDEGVEIPLKDLIAISSDRADRFGYGRHVTNHSVNWADLLEKANTRAKQCSENSDA